MLSFARVRALAVVAVLLLGALIAVYLAVSRDGGAAEAESAGCPEGSPVASLALPEPSQIKINVYNGTDQGGLATQLGETFGNRDFQVLEDADDPLDTQVDGVAVLRYGPAAVGAAHVLRAYFLDTAATEFDIARTDDAVDVVVGSAFRQLATPTEVRQSIAALGNPIPPPGTCPG